MKQSTWVVSWLPVQKSRKRQALQRARQSPKRERNSGQIHLALATIFEGKHPSDKWLVDRTPHTPYPRKIPTAVIIPAREFFSSKALASHLSGVRSFGGIGGLPDRKDWRLLLHALPGRLGLGIRVVRLSCSDESWLTCLMCFF